MRLQLWMREKHRRQRLCLYVVDDGDAGETRLKLAQRSCNFARLQYGSLADVRSSGCAPSCCRAELSSQTQSKAELHRGRDPTRIVPDDIPRLVSRLHQHAKDSSVHPGTAGMTLPTGGPARGAQALGLGLHQRRGQPPRVGDATPCDAFAACPPSNMNSAAYSAPPVVAGDVAGDAASPASSSVAPSFNTGGSRHQLNNPSRS